jgi:hypothetical protein
LPIVIAALIGGSYGVLRAPVVELFRRVSEHTASELKLTPLTEQQIESLTELVIAAMPAALAAYWLAVFSLNLYLAGRIARASGRLTRDWPDLAALGYPPGFPLLAALAIGASFMPGSIGVIGTSFAGALLFAYLLGGLALMHFIARRRAPWLLWIVYGTLLLFGPYSAAALATAGLLEPLLKLKQRFGTSPPST